MKRMPEPSVTYAEALGACREGIDNAAPIATKLDESVADLNTVANHYRATATLGQLYTIACIIGDDPLVVSNLKKSELIKLYEYYFRDKKPGRDLYDKILASANEQCPFCGGIGRPRNLDHYVPKAHFPQFSVLPINLIPSCRDCNMDGKGQAYATSAEMQILHPIMEAQHFFDTQWVFGEYTSAVGSDPSFITYYVDPPDHWNDIDKARVRQHFKIFDIAKRYSIQTAPSLVDVEAVIETLKRIDPHVDFKAIVLQPVINQLSFLNHWKRVMYVTLMEAL
jgi:hypothetical protein